MTPRKASRNERSTAVTAGTSETCAFVEPLPRCICLRGAAAYRSGSVRTHPGAAAAPRARRGCCPSPGAQCRCCTAAIKHRLRSGWPIEFSVACRWTGKNSTLAVARARLASRAPAAVEVGLGDQILHGLQDLLEEASLHKAGFEHLDQLADGRQR